MSNENINPEVLKMIESYPIDRRKVIAKALKIEYVIPRVSEQIKNKAFLSMYKRTNSKKDQLTITVPEVMDEAGTITPAVHLNPLYARQVAVEILRLCDQEEL